MSSDNKISVESYEIKKNKKKNKKNKKKNLTLHRATRGATRRHMATYGAIWRHTATRGATWRHTATQLQANGLRCNLIFGIILRLNILNEVQMKRDLFS